MCSENYTKPYYHYYHYNIIPFLNENILLSFGYFRYGCYNNRDEYKHCCLFDMKNNIFKEVDIDNIDDSKYDVSYFPLKIDNDKILFVFENSVKLFKFNIENINSDGNIKKNEKDMPKLFSIFDIFKHIADKYKEIKGNEKEKKDKQNKGKYKERNKSRSRSRKKKKKKEKKNSKRIKTKIKNK